MKHKRLVGFAAVIVGLAISASSPQAAKLDAAGVEAAVESYVDEAATPTEREKLLNMLAQVPNEDVAKEVKRSARKKQERSGALELALALHLRGLFKPFKKYIDESPVGIAKLGLITNDKGAHESLQKTWSESPIDSDTFSAITDAFMQHGANLESLEAFKDVLDSESMVQPRKDAAAKILAVQIGADTTDPTELSVWWASFKERYGDDGEQFEVSGFNLLEVAEFRSDESTRIGMNRKVAEGCALDATWPTCMSPGDYRVSGWFKFSADFVGNLGLRAIESDGVPTVLGPRFTNGVGVQASHPDDTIKWTIKPDEWVYMAWHIKEVKENGNRAWEHKIMLDDLSTSGDFLIHVEKTGFRIRTKAGTCVVSSLQLTRS